MHPAILAAAIAIPLVVVLGLCGFYTTVFRKPRCLFAACCKIRYKFKDWCCCWNLGEPVFRKNMTWIDQHVMLGGMPTSRGDLEFLARRFDISCIMSVQKRYELPPCFDAALAKAENRRRRRLARLNGENVSLITDTDMFESTGPLHELGMVHVNRSTPDWTVLPMKSLTYCVATLMLYATHERKVYLHCRRGQGRSGTVAVAYMCIAHNMTPEEAEEYIRNMRPSLKARTRANWAQIKRFVDEYWNSPKGYTIRTRVVNGFNKSEKSLLRRRDYGDEDGEDSRNSAAPTEYYDSDDDEDDEIPPPPPRRDQNFTYYIDDDDDDDIPPPPPPPRTSNLQPRADVAPPADAYTIPISSKPAADPFADDPAHRERLAAFRVQDFYYDAQGAQHPIEYDEEGYPLGVIDQQGNYVGEYDANGNNVGTYDEEGNYTGGYNIDGVYVGGYDAYGRLVGTYDRAGKYVFGRPGTAPASAAPAALDPFTMLASASAAQRSLAESDSDSDVPLPPPRKPTLNSHSDVELAPTYDPFTALEQPAVEASMPPPPPAVPQSSLPPAPLPTTPHPVASDSDDDNDVPPPAPSRVPTAPPAFAAAPAPTLAPAPVSDDEEDVPPPAPPRTPAQSVSLSAPPVLTELPELDEPVAAAPVSVAIPSTPVNVAPPSPAMSRKTATPPAAVPVASPPTPNAHPPALSVTNDNDRVVGADSDDEPPPPGRSRTNSLALSRASSRGLASPFSFRRPAHTPKATDSVDVAGVPVSISTEDPLDLSMLPKVDPNALPMPAEDDASPVAAQEEVHSDVHLSDSEEEETYDVDEVLPPPKQLKVVPTGPILDLAAPDVLPPPPTDAPAEVSVPVALAPFAEPVVEAIAEVMPVEAVVAAEPVLVPATEATMVAPAEGVVEATVEIATIPPAPAEEEEVTVPTEAPAPAAAPLSIDAIPAEQSTAAVAPAFVSVDTRRRATSVTASVAPAGDSDADDWETDDDLASEEDVPSPPARRISEAVPTSSAPVIAPIAQGTPVVAVDNDDDDCAPPPPPPRSEKSIHLAVHAAPVTSPTVIPAAADFAVDVVTENEVVSADMPSSPSRGAPPPPRSRASSRGAPPPPRSRAESQAAPRTVEAVVPAALSPVELQYETVADWQDAPPVSQATAAPVTAWVAADDDDDDMPPPAPPRVSAPPPPNPSPSSFFADDDDDILAPPPPPPRRESAPRLSAAERAATAFSFAEVEEKTVDVPPVADAFDGFFTDNM